MVLAALFPLVSRASRCRASRRLRLGLELLEHRSLPSVFTVTDLGDAGAGSGDQGDLRYCLTQANANAEPSNQIVFQSALTGVIPLTQGSLDITKDLEIDGPAQDLLQISGLNQSGVFNITADPGVQNVSFSDLTIANGAGIVTSTGTQGGGLYNDHATVTLTRVTFTNNAVPDQGQGGAIYNGSGTLTLEASTLEQNFAGFNGSAGIYNGPQGTVTIQDSTLSDNAASRDSGAGGIRNNGLLMLLNSSLTRNAGGTVGGIANDGGSLFVDHSTFTQNNGVNTSAVDSHSAMAITDSTLQGFPSIAQRVIIQQGSSLGTISGSTITNGFTGIEDDGNLTIKNSTITGNFGLGILMGQQSPLFTMTLTDSTVTANGLGGLSNAGRHPGMFALGNTIVAGNVSSSGALDVYGVFHSLGYNLIGAVDNRSMGWVATDQKGTLANPINPRLSGLQDNGGPTKTLAPLAGSPAVGRGDPLQLGEADQRGAPRETLTVGAVVANPAASLVVVAPDQVAPGQRFNFTVTAVDDAGFVATTYTGTVHIDSTDPNATLPGDHAFVATEAGVHTFTATLATPGEQTLTATDQDNPDVTGSTTVEVATPRAPTGRWGQSEGWWSDSDDLGLVAGSSGHRRF
jgi:hypothetical protein